MARTKNLELSKKQIAELKKHLEDERLSLINQARESLNQGMIGQERLVGDELDESSEENMKAWELRLRDRERGKLKKINHALARIGGGIFNECEECGGPIGYARLKARPMTTFCINCKEEQERREKQVHDASHEPPKLQIN